MTSPAKLEDRKTATIPAVARPGDKVFVVAHGCNGCRAIGYVRLFDGGSTRCPFCAGSGHWPGRDSYHVHFGEVVKISHVFKSSVVVPGEDAIYTVDVLIGHIKAFESSVFLTEGEAQEFADDAGDTHRDKRGQGRLFALKYTTPLAESSEDEM